MFIDICKGVVRVISMMNDAYTEHYIELLPQVHSGDVGFDKLHILELGVPSTSNISSVQINGYDRCGKMSYKRSMLSASTTAFQNRLVLKIFQNDRSNPLLKNETLIVLKE